ncbi:MAG: endolytic transglycosylase MltG [Deltaproteobacteria bacterium]|jgi:UPF0755 protein|nr:endolytic transglycosylase MltG [Deltaproteobacteria bacterium]
MQKKSKFRAFVTFIGLNFIFFACFLVGMSLVFGTFNSFFKKPLVSGSAPEENFLVMPGDNLQKIAYNMYNEGLIKSPRSLLWLAILKGDKVKKQLERLQPGEYKVSANMSAVKILKILLDPNNVVKYSITIIPGETVSDLIKKIGDSRLISRDEFAIGTNDLVFLQTLGIFTKSLEGYLLPDTYIFTKPTSAKEIIARIVKEGKAKFGTDEFNQRLIKLNMSFDQVLTMASIIEKETGVPEERPLVSSVLYNRLRLKMPLQSDPTVIYGVPDFKGVLTREDLKRPTSYNTYINKGLPPTPICNPSLESFKAALFPAETNYLYFVAKGDNSRSHVFSTTYAEHLKAVKEYRKSQALNEAIAEIEAEEKKKQQRLDLKSYTAPQKKETKKASSSSRSNRKVISHIDPDLKDEAPSLKDKRRDTLRSILD